MRSSIPFRTAVCVGLAAMLALVVTACGSSGDGSSTSAPTSETAGSTNESSKPETSPIADEVVSNYRDYLEQNAAKLTAGTKPFVAAVVAGELGKAKELYAPARSPYEAIEPVAATFGSLDPRIDARENDVPAKRFEGFHRLEKALWQEKSLKGMAPVAEQLVANVEELEEKVKSQIILHPEQIARGANELLSEVSTTKITGEEERYSHIDLVDFEANVKGAEAAFEAVKPMVVEKEPQLAQQVEAAFAKVYAGLEPYRRGQGFVLYGELTKADTRKLAQQIDALAEVLSQVPGVIYSIEHA